VGALDLPKEERDRNLGVGVGRGEDREKRARRGIGNLRPGGHDGSSEALTGLDLGAGVVGRAQPAVVVDDAPVRASRFRALVLGETPAR